MLTYSFWSGTHIHTRTRTHFKNFVSFTFQYFLTFTKRLLCNIPLPKLKSSQPSFLAHLSLYFFVNSWLLAFKVRFNIPSENHLLVPSSGIDFTYNYKEKSLIGPTAKLVFTIYVVPKKAMHGEPLLFLHLCTHGLTEESLEMGSQFCSHQKLSLQKLSLQVCCTLWLNLHRDGSTWGHLMGTGFYKGDHPL